MKCKRCGEIKLSKEFPSFCLSDECNHPPLHCLRCVTSFWEETQQCSMCNLTIDESSLNLRKCYQILQVLFPQITSSVIDEDDNHDGIAGNSGNVTVTRLNGESFDIPYNPSMTIYALKKKVEQFMKIPLEKQNLLYNQQKLQEYNTNHTSLCTLADHGIKPNTTIHLMVLLYAVPPNLDKVVFDLYWGYPLHHLDYLDALAFTFQGQEWLGWIGHQSKTGAKGSIRHSDDIMDDINRMGHQIINVSLKNVPSKVTHIFFTLSTWQSPTISHYQSPSMKFYEESRPQQMLCTDQISKASHRSAIIMCSLSRSDGQWFVHGNGTLSDGKLCHIEPMLQTIQGLIAQTGKYPYVPIKTVIYRPANRSGGMIYKSY